MKVEANRVPEDPNAFKSYTISITVEDAQDDKTLYAFGYNNLTLPDALRGSHCGDAPTVESFKSLQSAIQRARGTAFRELFNKRLPMYQRSN